MKKDVIMVPLDKCPLDVIAELKEETENAWIFLHRNALRKLISLADTCERLQMIPSYYNLHWKATESFPETQVCIYYNEMYSEWASVITIEASDIAFKKQSPDPENIFFLKMVA